MDETFSVVWNDIGYFFVTNKSDTSHDMSSKYIIYELFIFIKEKTYKSATGCFEFLDIFKGSALLVHEHLGICVELKCMSKFMSYCLYIIDFIVFLFISQNAVSIIFKNFFIKKIIT